MTRVHISDAARMMSVSIDTLRRWDKGGILRATRNAQGVRQFNLNEIHHLMNQRARRTDMSDQPGMTFLSDRVPNGLTAIDLFAGGGGTALGLSNAGFTHCLLSEIDENAVSTLRYNKPEWNVVSGDVQNIDFRSYYGRVDLVEGGFPCQAFSYAGRSLGFNDTRGTLFFEFARAIQEVMPKAFIGENVKGLLRHDKGKTLATMKNVLKDIRDPHTGVGYKVAIRVVRSQYHDVPQKRERLIMMGIREDIGNTVYFPRERDYIVPLWDAIGDYPQGPGQEYPAKKKHVLDLVPAGGYWKDLPLDIQKEYLGGSFHLSGGKTGMARRLSWDEPSLTLTCSPAQKQTERCHPEQTRPLNIREYARIQTFPDTWEFIGNLSSQYRQIGNAVPVNLAYYLGKCVQAAIQPATRHNPIIAPFITPAHPEEYI